MALKSIVWWWASYKTKRMNVSPAMRRPSSNGCSPGSPTSTARQPRPVRAIAAGASQARHRRRGRAETTAARDRAGHDGDEHTAGEQRARGRRDDHEDRDDRPLSPAEHSTGRVGTAEGGRERVVRAEAETARQQRPRAERRARRRSLAHAPPISVMSSVLYTRITLPTASRSSVEVKIDVKAMNTPGLNPPMPSAASPSPSSEETAQTAIRRMLRWATPITAVSTALTPPTSATAASTRGDARAWDRPARAGTDRAARPWPQRVRARGRPTRRRRSAKRGTGTAPLGAPPRQRTRCPSRRERVVPRSQRVVPDSGHALGDDVPGEGSARSCPEGAASSDAKTPNLIHVKTTPSVSAMSPAVSTTMMRSAVIALPRAAMPVTRAGRAPLTPRPT